MVAPGRASAVTTRSRSLVNGERAGHGSAHKAATRARLPRVPPSPRPLFSASFSRTRLRFAPPSSSSLRQKKRSSHAPRARRAGSKKRGGVPSLSRSDVVAANPNICVGGAQDARPTPIPSLEVAAPGVAPACSKTGVEPALPAVRTDSTNGSNSGESLQSVAGGCVIRTVFPPPLRFAPGRILEILPLRSAHLRPPELRSG
jgi:hypothetical protein